MKYDGTILKELTEKTGIPQVEIAKAIGISQGTYMAYLRGNNFPTIENLIKIADYFAVPIDLLIGRCTKEQEETILSDYSQTFMKLRRAPYESYLAGRRPLPAQIVNQSCQ